MMSSIIDRHRAGAAFALAVLTGDREGANAMLSGPDAGDTAALAVATLGGIWEAVRVDNMDGAAVHPLPVILRQILALSDDDLRAAMAT